MFGGLFGDSNLRVVPKPLRLAIIMFVLLLGEQYVVGLVELRIPELYREGNGLKSMLPID